MRAAAVAARPAGFLVVVGERLWHGEVDDVAYIWLVDAHAKGQSGANQLNLAFGPLALADLALGDVEVCVVKGAKVPAPDGLLDGLADDLAVAPGQAVDEAALVEPGLDKGLDFRNCFDLARFRPDLVDQLLAIERSPPSERVSPEPEDLADVLDDAVVGRRGQSHDGHPRELGSEALQSEVVWPKVVAPARDTMRLVDDEPREEAAPRQRLQRAHRRRRMRELLRGQVQQLELAVRLEAVQFAEDVGCGAAVEAAECGGPDTRLVHRIDLVLDQRH
mmetsp:Transcript_23303/g.83270  ORF Transcript_23303/g.83270 Transcript_23303/m.83270 type:complete len:277 (-) Transcript_23303:207-1037(-)